MRDYSVKIKKEVLRKPSEKACSAGRKRQITVDCDYGIKSNFKKKESVGGSGSQITERGSNLSNLTHTKRGVTSNALEYSS